ncbi:unnamed protein product [Caenorhabditis brenneri]
MLDSYFSSRLDSDICTCQMMQSTWPHAKYSVCLRLLHEANLTKKDSELEQINGHYREVLESDNTRMLDIERKKEENMESQPSATHPTLKRDACIGTEDGKAEEVDPKRTKISRIVNCSTSHSEKRSGKTKTD